jgi:hypothetical protein
MQYQHDRYTTARPVDSDDDDDDMDLDEDDSWYPRMPKSALRISDISRDRMTTGRFAADARSSSGERLSRSTRSHPIPPRSTAMQGNNAAPVSARSRTSAGSNTSSLRRARDTEELPRLRLHWLVFVGVALIIMVLGWVVFTVVANWWQVTQDNMQYGYPRTYQTDAVVGHSDSTTNPSHFIAINLNSHVEVIEFPGGDASKAKIYVGPTLIGPNSNLAPVTLTFKDVNGDGLPDMIVNVQGGHFVFINQNGQFRPAQPSDNVHI